MYFSNFLGLTMIEESPVEGSTYLLVFNRTKEMAGWDDEHIIRDGLKLTTRITGYNFNWNLYNWICLNIYHGRLLSGTRTAWAVRRITGSGPTNCFVQSQRAGAWVCTRPPSTVVQQTTLIRFSCRNRQNWESWCCTKTSLKWGKNNECATHAVKSRLCSSVVPRGESHRASLLGASKTLLVCSFHTRLMPPCMWDQLLSQAYPKKSWFSHIRATTHEEPVAVVASAGKHGNHHFGPE